MANKKNNKKVTVEEVLLEFCKSDSCKTRLYSKEPKIYSQYNDKYELVSIQESGQTVLYDVNTKEVIDSIPLSRAKSLLVQWLRKHDPKKN